MNQIEANPRHVPEIVDYVVDRLMAEGYADLSDRSDLHLYQDRSLHRQMMEGKIEHTEDVVCATDDIIREMGGRIEGSEEEWNSYQAGAIARLHDIGRFTEITKYGTFNSRVTGFDHSKDGALIFDFLFGNSDEGRILERLGCDLQVIEEAISYHSVKDYRGNNQYVYLIRDADKLALLRRLDFQEDVINRDQNLAAEGYSADVVRQVLADHTSVSHGTVLTKADSLIRLFAFLLNINFDATKGLLLRSAFLPELIKKFQEYSLPNEVIKAMINVVVEEWNKTAKTTTFTRQDFPLVE